MRMRQLEYKMLHRAPNEVRCRNTVRVIASFIRKKRSECMDDTVSFKEIIDYIKQNKLIISSTIKTDHKTDEELLTELLAINIELSKEDKKFIKSKYLMKQILILGIYPQLDKCDYTLLGLAACFADNNYIKKLLEEGADINLPMVSGFTPLMMAVDNDAHFSIYNSSIKVLLEAGADYEQKSDELGFGMGSDTALDRAVMRNNESAVKLLLKYGASISDKTMLEAEKKIRSTSLPYSPERNILNLLNQARSGLIETKQSLISGMLHEATSQKLIKDVSDVIASYDTRSYGLRYFKMTKNHEKKDLISEEPSTVDKVKTLIHYVI